MKLLFQVLTLLSSLCCAPQLLAQDAGGYPNRPIHIVVPFSTGGPGDVLARVIAERLRSAWKQPVIIDYRPGAATQIGTAAVAKAAPDGYTMGIVTMAHVTNPSWFEGQLPYDAIRDLRGVTQIVDLHIAILATPKLEANNLAELIALSKKKPGEITFATVPGTGGHLAGEFLNTLTGASLRFVPYKGAQDVKNDLIPGRIDLSFDPLTAADMQLVQAKRLKVLALAGSGRSKLAPDYPLASETVPSFVASGMMGLVVPKATPTDIVQRIYRELNKAMQSGDLREAIMQLFMEPKLSSPEEFDALIASETSKWTGVVRKIRAGSPDASRK
ncbi:tripartite tricarboxylate transporter substrate-binding protein [Ramlibacter albus]|uniref:Tripartite tricarboxylate transporter substrate binding protein n=1 Tax=Ramlibacter albus TaxID=2079448 RepID=A0A923S0W9_9BURK|nr:tripartite tricarboxylate transporter substrate-binding protein [Ramlibacter albus]MBC5763028.1 tripartite tricarboxylate transporter substrate binding protein [Ramlibacter albus]